MAFAIEVKDPYKGLKYSEIISIPGNVATYRQPKHPLIKVPGTGQAVWEASIARWVV